MSFLIRSAAAALGLFYNPLLATIKPTTYSILTMSGEEIVGKEAAQPLKSVELYQLAKSTRHPITKGLFKMTHNEALLKRNSEEVILDPTSEVATLKIVPVSIIPATEIQSWTDTSVELEAMIGIGFVTAVFINTDRDSGPEFVGFALLTRENGLKTEMDFLNHFSYLIDRPGLKFNSMEFTCPCSATVSSPDGRVSQIASYHTIDLQSILRGVEESNNTVMTDNIQGIVGFLGDAPVGNYDFFLDPRIYIPVVTLSRPGVDS
jgi:hypothetical protein